MQMKALETLRALYWAEIHAKEAKAVCALIREWSGPPISQELLYALFTGIVVSYCRSFGQNDGLSKISSKFSTFHDPEKRVLHKHLMKVRNILFAHKNRLREHEVLDPAHSKELPKIKIIVAQDGSTEWEVTRGEPKIDYIKDIENLCDFQIKRLNDTSSEMLGHSCKGKAYDPGKTYVLGDGFP
jgi:hypothetical protein